MPRAPKFSHCFLPALVLVTAMAFTVGCGSSSSQHSTKIRFVNASPDPNAASVNVLIDGTTVATALANGGAATAYLAVTAGARHIQIQDAGNSQILVDS